LYTRWEEEILSRANSKVHTGARLIKAAPDT
jgi:hypothetical protein